MYNVKLLEDDVACEGIQRVAEYIGMPMEKKGCTTFVACPNPEHHESNHDNAQISRDGTFIHCYLCGPFDVFKVVKLWYQKEYNEDLTFPEVCGIIGDALGGREMYEMDREDADKLINEKKIMYDLLSNDERAFLHEPKTKEEAKERAERLLSRYQRLASESPSKTEAQAALLLEWRRRRDLCQNVLNRINEETSGKKKM